MFQRLQELRGKWRALDAVYDSPPLMTDATEKAISNLENHVRRGCLSDISVVYLTSINENLHNQLNRLAHGLKPLGPELAVAILTIFFGNGTKEKKVARNWQSQAELALESFYTTMRNQQ